MSLTKAKKTYGVFLGIIIGVIILSFALSGFFGRENSPDVIAQVGSNNITIKEYRPLLQQFINRFSYGGQLSAKQIEQLGVKRMVLNQLIEQKLLLNLADQMNLKVSPQEVAEEIKNLPYFKQDGQFNINLYKNALAMNGYTPKQFEDMIASDLLTKQIFDLYAKIPLSMNYRNDLKSFKEDTLLVNVVKLDKKAMEPALDVSAAEVFTYLSKPENLTKVANYFNYKKKELDKPEQVKARHILLRYGEGKDTNKVHAQALDLIKKINAANFVKIANETTEDPSGKKNGGDLGWFSKGRMVPEFEKAAFEATKGSIIGPIVTSFGEHIIYVEDKKAAKEAVFEDFKDSLAIELIKKDNPEKINQLVKKVSEAVERALNSSDEKELNALKAKFSLVIVKDSLNRIDSKVGDVTLENSLTEQIFSTKNTSIVYKNEGPSSTTLAKVIEKTVAKPESKKEKINPENPFERDLDIIASQEVLYSQKLLSEMIKKAEKQTKIKINEQML